MPTKPRILLYSHDTYGLGHLRRSLSVAGQIARDIPNAHQLLVTGSMVAGAFGLPPRLDMVKLPALSKRSSGEYKARALPLTLKRTLAWREQMILQAAINFNPHLVLVDKVAGGVHGELLPTLRHLKAWSPDTKIVLGMRDIEDSPSATQAEWAKNKIPQLLDNVYDAILLYGQRAVFDPLSAYNMSPSASGKVIECGYLRRALSPAAPTPSPSPNTRGGEHAYLPGAPTPSPSPNTRGGEHAYLPGAPTPSPSPNTRGGEHAYLASPNTRGREHTYLPFPNTRGREHAYLPSPSIGGGAGGGGRPPLVLLTVGGGGDGYEIIKTYMEMLAAQADEVPYHSIIVTGPLMAEGKRKQLRQAARDKPVTFFEFTPDLVSYMAAADLVVSMAGYNTVCEILSLQKRALLIPRMRVRAEQALRAMRLAERGLAQVLLPTELTPQRLATQIECALSAPPPPATLDLDGLPRVSAAIADLLNQ